MANNNQADQSTIVSLVSATLSITSIQPLFTLLASLVAIVSGVMAIRYYYKMTKKLK
jgi:hypothetical protein